MTKGTLAETVAFHRDPLGALERARAKHGDVFTLRLTFIGPVVAVTGDAVDDLAGSDPDRSAAGEARRSVLPMAAVRSVFGGDGLLHAAARHRLAATFGPEAMAGRRDRMAEIAAEHAALWPRGRPFGLLPRMRALADEIFVRLILGIRDDDRAAAVARALGAMLRTPGNPPLPPPGPGDGIPGAIGQALFERRRLPLARLLLEEVSERRAAGLREGAEDVVAALLSADPPLSDEEVVEEVVTLMMAGQEPPSIALSWILDRLLRHPRLADDYLEAGPGTLRSAVALETLRLRPPAMGILRNLRAPLQVGRHTLPAGTSTMVPIPLLHRDPRLYDEPNRFRPARWLGPAQPPFAGFGGGARRCIGEALALAEIDAIVPVVLRSARLRPLWPRTERMVVRGTVLAPHRSLPVINDA